MGKQCRVCGEEYDDAKIQADGACIFCAEREAFSAFAKSCGLEVYPDPTGERYVYRLDHVCDGKKSENNHLIDVFWNALVRAKGGADELLIG